MSPDDFYRNIERHMSFELSHGGDVEQSVSQHLGRIINHQNIYNTSLVDNTLAKIDRLLKGERGNRWDGQNKMSELEKKIKEDEKWMM